MFGMKQTTTCKHKSVYFMTNLYILN